MDVPWLKTFRFAASVIKEDDYAKLTDFIVELKNDEGDKIAIQASKELVVEDKVFHKPVRIDLTRSAKIEFHRCVFEKSLSFDPHGAKPVKNVQIFLFKTAINEGLYVHRTAAYEEINIDTSLMRAFVMTEVEVDNLEFYKSDISEIYFPSSTVIGTHVDETAIIS
jgi:hypothetical protein